MNKSLFGSCTTMILISSLSLGYAGCGDTVRGYNPKCDTPSQDAGAVADDAGFDVPKRCTSLSLGYAGCGDTARGYNPKGDAPSQDAGAVADDAGFDIPRRCIGELSRYPEMFVTDGAFNGYLVVGVNAPTSDLLAMMDIASSMKYTNRNGESVPVTVGDATMLDEEVASISAQNTIVVGNPCYNTLAAELLGNPEDCTEGFTSGQGRIKLFKHANGRYALLVAGYSTVDTRLAARVIEQRHDELSGMEVIVAGPTASEAILSCQPEE